MQFIIDITGTLTQMLNRGCWCARGPWSRIMRKWKYFSVYNQNIFRVKIYVWTNQIWRSICLNRTGGGGKDRVFEWIKEFKVCGRWRWWLMAGGRWLAAIQSLHKTLDSIFYEIRKPHDCHNVVFVHFRLIAYKTCFLKQMWSSKK